MGCFGYNRKPQNRIAGIAFAGIAFICAFGAKASLMASAPVLGADPFSAPTLSLDDIANLAANPLAPGQQTTGASTAPFTLSTTFSYANDYWFRYRDIAPNRLNLMNNSELDVNLRQFGDVYLKLFADYSNNVRKPYMDSLQQGIAGVRSGTTYTNNVPTSDFTELDLTIGYHYDLMSLLGLDAGYTNFITPVNSWSSVAGAQPVQGGHGQTDMQEVYVKATLNTQSFLNNIALNPYIYVGFDFNGAYYMANAGEYYEAGLSPTFTIPNTNGLVLNPYASVAAIQNEKRLDANQVSYRDGYLGSTVGIGANYPANSLLNIPANFGAVSVGGFVEEVFAGTRYSQPTGSHSEATVVGLSLGWNY